MAYLYAFLGFVALIVLHEAGHFTAAKAVGFGTWGYVLNEPAHIGGDRLRRFAASPDIDLLGAPLTESDALVSEVVAQARANDKPTLAWAVLTAAGRDRALRLGCQGLMAAEIRGLLGLDEAV